MRSGFDEVYRVTDRRRSRLRGRRKCLAMRVAGHQQQAVDQAFHQRVPHQRMPRQAVPAIVLTVHQRQLGAAVVEYPPGLCGDRDVVGCTTRRGGSSTSMPPPPASWQRGTNENTVSVGGGPAGLIGQAGAGSLR